MKKVIISKLGHINELNNKNEELKYKVKTYRHIVSNDQKMKFEPIKSSLNNN